VSRRKSGFNYSVVTAAGENWAGVKGYNSVVRRLEKRRAARVGVEGPFAKSKIAWKAAVLQQALLFRVIELGNACSEMWNLKNVLGSVLAARALLETIAVTLDFEVELQKHYKANDFEALDKLITSHTFATREPHLIAEIPEVAAKNVLTYIDRLSARAKLPLREHYDDLSEWCHPNSYGHYFTFGSLDRNTGIVTFSRLKLHGKDMLNHILTVYLLVGMVEEAMDRLDALILNIAEAHSVAFLVRQK
jgi:hypothetical protein